MLKIYESGNPDNYIEIEHLKKTELSGLWIYYKKYKTQLSNIPQNYDKIILGTFITGELLKKYNYAIDKMTKKGIFSKIYETLKNDKNTFLIRKVLPTEYKKLMSENGDFTRTVKSTKKWLGWAKNEPGSKENPHKISLVSPLGKRKGGFTQSTIFEEMFHAYQFLKDPDNQNNLEIETEAKVAKIFQLYSQIKKDDYLADVTNFNAGKYELELLYTFVKGKKLYEYHIKDFNKVVKKYFDCLLENRKISTELENNFRIQVKELGKRVNIKYKKHFNGKKFKNTGNTENFDKFFK